MGSLMLISWTLFRQPSIMGDMFSFVLGETYRTPILPHEFYPLTHRGRMTHICVSKIDHHRFRWWLVAWPAPSHYLNTGILLIRTLGPNFSEIEIHTFSFKKMQLKMSSGKRRPFCQSDVMFENGCPLVYIYRYKPVSIYHVVKLHA